MGQQLTSQPYHKLHDVVRMTKLNPLLEFQIALVP